MNWDIIVDSELKAIQVIAVIGVQEISVRKSFPDFEEV